MERYVEMREYIADYRNGRKQAKGEYLSSHSNDVLDPLLNILESMIQGVGQQQAANEQGKIKYLIFHRLRSSEYTESYEISISISNAALYLDENTYCTYWKPQIVYQNFAEDMKRVRQILNSKYSRIEEYELLRIKQSLLLDDWQLFCEILSQTAERLAEKIKESPLHLEDEIQILYGDYMDKLDVACTL